jgi:hypothetical protein
VVGVGVKVGGGEENTGVTVGPFPRTVGLGEGTLVPVSLPGRVGGPEVGMELRGVVVVLGKIVEPPQSTVTVEKTVTVRMPSVPITIPVGSLVGDKVVFVAVTVTLGADEDEGDGKAMTVTVAGPGGGEVGGVVVGVSGVVVNVVMETNWRL